MVMAERHRNIDINILPKTNSGIQAPEIVILANKTPALFATERGF